MNWDPVDDSGGSSGGTPGSTKSTTGEESGFGFDLGDALARLGLGDGADHGPMSADAAVAPPPSDVPLGWLGDRHPAEVPPLERRTSGTGTPPPEDVPKRWLDELRTDHTSSSPLPPVVSELPSRTPTRPAPSDDTTVVPAAPAADDLPTRKAPSAEESLPRRGAAPSPVQPDARRAAPEPQSAHHPVQQPVVHQPVAPQPVAYTPDEGTPRPYVAPRRSVFDDVVSSSPSLPPTIVSAPTATSTPSVTMSAGQPISAPAAMPGGLAPQPAASPSGAPAAPTVPGGQNAVFLPTLPAAAPAAPPPMAIASATAAAHVDPRTLRSAHVRARKQQRRSRLIGKVFLALLVIGGMFGAALAFGRPYLFPTEWDPSLTRVVDQVELERGGAFDHTVGLVEQNDADFALTLARLAVGDEWVAHVAEWRALGLAGGDPTLAVLADDVAVGRVAVYDPTTDRVYKAMSADEASSERDLRVALELAYDTQLGVVPVPTDAMPGTLAGVSGSTEIADRAIDVYLAGLQSAMAPATAVTVPAPSTVPAATVSTTLPGAPVATTPAVVPAAMPVPIQYELLVVEQLAGQAVAAAALDPENPGFDVQLGSVLDKALDDAPAATDAGPLQVGENSLRDPVALGVDDWSLVWAARLPTSTVDQLVGLVVADSYRPIDRAGVTCVSGVFQSASAEASAIVLSAMTAWVAAAPVESQAVASPLSETRVQLVTCDPGNTVAAPVTDAAAQLLARQLARAVAG